jgi:glycosyltransferase involved in cell wall biosynthesis
MNKPLRITWIFPELNFSGGILANRLFADEMVALGHDVTIVAPSMPSRAKPKPWQLRRIAEEARLQLELMGKPQHHAQSSRAKIIAAPGSEVLEEHVPDADVVIATWWRTMEWVHRFSEAKGAKAYFIHGYEVFGGAAWRVDNTYKLPARHIVVSRWLQSIMKDRFGRTDAVVVHNGIDPSLFYHKPRDRGTPPTVGMIYSPVPLKQSLVAFEAFKRLQHKHPDVRVVCFGSHKPPASQTPANFTFVLRPQQHETPQLYRQCDCWILPSTTEGFGLPGLEACACGVPVVCTRCGGPEDYVKHGENGLLVPTGDVDAMSRSIEDVLFCPAERWRDMSSNAAATAGSFRWDTSAKRLEIALHEAVQQRSGLFAADLPASRTDRTETNSAAVTSAPSGTSESVATSAHQEDDTGRYTQSRMTGPRLRISWVLPEANLSGGVKSNRLIAEAMMRRGHVVTLYLPKDSGKRWPMPWRARQFARRVRSEVEAARRPAHHLMVSSVPIIAVDGDEVRAKHLPDADIVIGTWWRTMEWLRAYPPSKGKHAYFIRHHELFGGPKERVVATYMQPSIKLVIARWLQQLMTEQYNDPNSVLVPNGIDHTQFGAKEREKNATPTIGFMYGGPVTWKDAATAIKAIQILQQKLPNAKIVSFGGHAWMDGHPQPSNLEYHFKPAQTLIPELYRKCDVWIMPSTSEGFGMPGIEAAACRCPIVSTRCGGPEDYVVDGTTGYLVPVADAQAMADALFKVLSLSPSQWKQMSAASQAKACTFDWDSSAKLLEDGIYRALGVESQARFKVQGQTDARATA